MSIIVEFTYSNNYIQEFIVDGQSVLRGLVVDGERPTKARCYLLGPPQTIDKDRFLTLFTKCICRALHPVGYKISMSAELQVTLGVVLEGSKLRWPDGNQIP